jgi:hypothetical protein
MHAQSGRIPTTHLTILAALMGTMALAPTSASGQAAPRSSAGDALSSIFNPHRAPARRTMGLLQRSFLDLVESSQSHLQVALVVDGTESMTNDLDGVRTSMANMVEDLRRYLGDNVSFALVVYRDTGSPSGDVAVPLKQFTTSQPSLELAFANIVPETGAPYFPELIDAGIHAALTQLDWSEGPDTTRWLMAFGDAPPFDPDFVAPQGIDARRRYDTNLLVDLARQKQIQINCVLCTSTAAQEAAYRGVLDKTRAFMNRLASETSGLMLDLSYPDIRAALVDANRIPRVETYAIGRITRGEVETARASAAGPGSPQLVRLAVLPHMALNQLTFNPDSPEVQVAADLRYKLKQLPHLEVRSPVDVQRQLRRLRAGGLEGDQLMQALAVQLGVDYIVWGEYQPAPPPAIHSAVYTRQDGRRLVSAELRSDSATARADLVNQVAGQLVARAVSAGGDNRFRAVLASLGDRQRAALESPLAEDPAVAAHLRAGLEGLEQALAYPVGSPEGVLLLAQAERHLSAAIESDARNPLAHLLLGNCFYNQAQALLREGRAEDAHANMRRFASALRRAYLERERTTHEGMKAELVADYTLLIRRDFEAAIRSYEALLEAPDTATHSALRAHWMLAGIYSGDWETPEPFINAERARAHVVQILARWEDSSEASLLREALRWNEESGGTQLGHLPRRNAPLGHDWATEQ